MADLSVSDLPKSGLPEEQRRAGPWSRVLGSWWRGSGALPTTPAGVEICLLVAFIGLRITDIVQLAVAFPEGLRRTTAPALDGLLMALYLLESVAISVRVIRRRRYDEAAWAWLDVSVPILVLLLEPVFTTTADRVGTWTAWGYAVSVGASLGTGIGFTRRWQTITAASALAASYLIVSLPAASGNVTATVLSNTVAYFGFAIFTRALAGYLRRLGRDAEAARTRAAEAGRQAELDRHRLLLHDQATVLRFLSQPDIDPALAALLREQAASGAARIRSFLTDASPPYAVSADASPDLVGVVRRATGAFTDLPIELSLDLAAGVELNEPATRALDQAVTTLLHNVRSHAQARAVFIHADVTDDGEWEIVVRDDGVGFDAANAPPGFGLTTQFHAALSAVGIRARIESRLGEGTTATMCGSIAGEPT